MSFSRLNVLILTGALLALIITLSAPLAAYTARVSTEKKSDGTAAVLINNRTAIRFLVSNGGLAPAERAEITAGRIKALVAAGVSPRSITTKPNGPRFWIASGETNICLVTPADAKAGKTTAQALATTWASQMRELLSMPAIEIKQTEIMVPLTETRTVQIGGASTAPITCADSIPDVATSEVAPGQRAVVVSGKTVGDSRISVTCDGETATMLVRVRKYAGRVTQTPSVQVTGHPVPASLIESLAATVVEKSIEVESGATASVGSVKFPQIALNPGMKTVIQVPVKIEGGGHIPVSAHAPVEVVNVRVEQKPVGTLLYSNNPESVFRYQTLFTGPIESKVPTRLLYHHQNQMGKRFRFNLEIINPSYKAARVHIISAVANPIVDTVLVGYIAGSKFMRDYINQVGYVVDIPANSKYVVYSDNVDHIRTASGIMEFRELTGTDLDLKVTADVPGTADYKIGQIASLRDSDKNFKYHEDIFPSPNKQITATYNVGERWAFISIGRHAITHDETGKPLYGNYGVLYDIKVDIHNPTATARKVSVLFDAGAGLAGAVFYVDGKFVESKYVNPPNEFTVASYNLEPNQSKRISILTVPLAGSSYPANITIRS